jgi:hypothetical protein
MDMRDLSEPRLTAGRLFLVAVAMLATGVAGTSADAQTGLTALTARAPDEIAKIHAGPGGVLLTSRQGRVFRLAVSGDRLSLVPDSGALLPRPQLLAGMIPGGGVAQGARNIRRAWFVNPTRRYPHGALGDDVEAGGLRAVLGSGIAVEHRLDAGSVFEDLVPRIVDVDGDGRDEILAIRSALGRGSSLVLLSADEGGINVLAETPQMGGTNRWMNPVGIGDFDGDGEIEVGAVETPHIGGVLTIYKLSRGALRPIVSRLGFSNHRMGSTELGLSVVTDANGDGVVDIVIPDASRFQVKAVSFAGSRYAEVAATRHTAEVSTNMIAAELDGLPGEEVVYGLSDGTVVVLRFLR